LHQFLRPGGRRGRNLRECSPRPNGMWHLRQAEVLYRGSRLQRRSHLHGGAVVHGCLRSRQDIVHERLQRAGRRGCRWSIALHDARVLPEHKVRDALSMRDHLSARWLRVRRGSVAGPLRIRRGFAAGLAEGWMPSEAESSRLWPLMASFPVSSVSRLLLTDPPQLGPASVTGSWPGPPQLVLTNPPHLPLASTLAHSSEPTLPKARPILGSPLRPR
jgi:hypothetical protein